MAMSDDDLSIDTKNSQSTGRLGRLVADLSLCINGDPADRHDQGLIGEVNKNSEARDKNEELQVRHKIRILFSERKAILTFLSAMLIGIAAAIGKIIFNYLTSGG